MKIPHWKLFSLSNFLFFGRGKINFLEGSITSKLASQWPSWGIYKHAPPVLLAQKTFVIFKKRWPNKNLFLGRPACIFFFLGGVLDFYHLFCCWCHVAFPFSHGVVLFVSFAFACCLGLLYMILVSHTVVSARVSFYCRVCVSLVHYVFSICLAVLQIRSIAVAL